jgi:hypothetical protein
MLPEIRTEFRRLAALAIGSGKVAACDIGIIAAVAEAAVLRAKALAAALASSPTLETGTTTKGNPSWSAFVALDARYTAGLQSLGLTPPGRSTPDAVPARPLPSPEAGPRPRWMDLRILRNNNGQ